MGNTKQLNPQRVFKDAVVNALSNNTCDLAFNPMGKLELYKQSIICLWSDYDINQCCSRYKWEGLPKGLNSNNLERMLYYKGELACIDYMGMPIILPYIPTKSFNFYGNSKRCSLITFSGYSGVENDEPVALFSGKEFDLVIDGEKDEYTEEDLKDVAIKLQDKIPHYTGEMLPSRFYLNNIIIEKMADVFSRININITVANKKLIFTVKDGNIDNATFKQLMNILSSDMPFSVLPYNLEVNSFQNTNDLQAEALFQTIKEYDNIRCLMSGINTESYGSAKKERKITLEMQGVNEQVDMVADTGLELRKNFCDAYNKKFAKYGVNLTVHRRDDELKENSEKEFEEKKEGDYNESSDNNII